MCYPNPLQQQHTRNHVKTQTCKQVKLHEVIPSHRDTEINTKTRVQVMGDLQIQVYLKFALAPLPFSHQSPVWTQSRQHIIKL